MKIEHFGFDGVVAKGFAAKNWVKAILTFLRLVMSASITRDTISMLMEGKTFRDISIRGVPQPCNPSDQWMLSEWEFRSEVPNPRNFRDYTGEELKNAGDLEVLMVSVDAREGVSIPRSPADELVRGVELRINLDADDEEGDIERGFLKVEGALLRLCHDPAVACVTIWKEVGFYGHGRPTTLTLERRRDGGLDLSGEGIPDGYSPEEESDFESYTRETVERKEKEDEGISRDDDPPHRGGSAQGRLQ